MGKSKSGGTRGFLRGKIANDVYSIGKDGNGKKQQVVRALAVSVANPRTTAQMRGRMIMSTVMQAVAGFAPIIDHSFDGVATGQPSISKFIRENYALIKADAAAYPSGDNLFGLLKYKERRVSKGAWLVSDGNQSMPSGWNHYNGYLAEIIPLGKMAATFADLKAIWNAAGFEYMTLIGVISGQGVYARIQLATDVADATVLSALNIASCFTFDGNATPNIQLSDDEEQQYVTIAWGDGQTSSYDAIGAIFTYAVAGGYEHSHCAMSVCGRGGDYNCDTALPTYPTGTEQFLNGGEI